MAKPASLLACVWTLAALAAACLAPAATAKAHSFLRSRELWATIDVCNPTDQPDTIGVRGSMPSDGQAHDTMYMSFRLQYMKGTSWVALASAGSPAPGWVAVGAAKAARQAGRSFQLVPVAGRPAFTLRGLVTFQWRHGSKVVATTYRVTAAGHQSLAGADPANFSAATCVLG